MIRRRPTGVVFVWLATALFYRIAGACAQACPMSGKKNLGENSQDGYSLGSHAGIATEQAIEFSIDIADTMLGSVQSSLYLPTGQPLRPNLERWDPRLNFWA